MTRRATFEPEPARLTQSAEAMGPAGHFPLFEFGRTSMAMKAQLSPAEDLPALYRAVLDAVAALEHRGARVEASRIRRDATRAYSRAWDEVQRQRLEQLVERSRQAMEQNGQQAERPIWRGFRRQPASHRF